MACWRAGPFSPTAPGFFPKTATGLSALPVTPVEETEGLSTARPPTAGRPDPSGGLCAGRRGPHRRRAGLRAPTRPVHPTAGSKEGVYIISTVATPPAKNGQKPVVALPNPFYQAYLGGAVLS